MRTPGEGGIFGAVFAAIVAYALLWRFFYVILLLQYSYFAPPRGTFDAEYRSVVDAFRENFEMGLEREGAHLSIFHRGRLVVNVWSGYADSSSSRVWNEQTITTFFSSTKALSAMCVAMLVDRGRLAYDDLVVKYWPEYGQFGKQNTTIEDVLTHKAGIPYIEHITMDDVADNAVMMKKIETAKPLWPPGTASGYHAVTFGWLVDGIFRKVDEKGRNVREFFKEEIADKYGIDVSIGLEGEKFARMARVTQPGLLEYARDIFGDPRTLVVLALMYARSPNSIAAKLRMHPSWIPLNYDTVALNDPAILALNMASVTGVGNAHNFARIFALALDGTLIGNATLATISQPTVANWHLEQVVLYPFVKGHGFYFEPHPVHKAEYLIGHPGYGGQALNVDVREQLVISYLSNGLKTGTGEICQTYQRILRALYRAIS